MLQIVFVFFVLLGPKIGFVDLSVLIPFVVSLYFLSKAQSIPLEYVVGFFLVCLILLWQLFVGALNGVFDTHAIGRLLRVGLAVFCVSLFVAYSVRKGLDRAFRAILYVLIFHSLLIVVSALSMNVAEIISVFSGNERFRMFRSSGLLAGFDIAGFLILIGMLMVLFRKGGFSDRLGLYMMLLFVGSSVFTSRVTLLIALVVFAIYVVMILAGRFRVGFVSGLFSVILFSLLFFWLIVLLDVAFSFGALGLPQWVEPFIVKVFASASALSGSFLWSDMFFLPDGNNSVLFGIGVEPGGSDVGYVREIFRYGVVGLVLAILFHVVFVSMCVTVRGGGGIWLSLFFLFFIFALSFKNNYFFVRGVFPLFLMIVSLSSFECMGGCKRLGAFRK